MTAQGASAAPGAPRDETVRRDHPNGGTWPSDTPLLQRIETEITQSRRAELSALDTARRVLAALDGLPDTTVREALDEATMQRAIDAVNALPVGHHMETWRCDDGSCGRCNLNNRQIIETVAEILAASGSGLPDTEEAADAPCLTCRMTEGECDESIRDHEGESCCHGCNHAPPPAPLTLPDNTETDTRPGVRGRCREHALTHCWPCGHVSSDEWIRAYRRRVAPSGSSPASPVPAALPPSPVGPAQGDGA